MRRVLLYAGYASNTKGYKVLNLAMNTVKVSRAVLLVERKVGSIFEDNIDNDDNTGDKV